jgi:uracil-DNA glycosylase family 4
MADPKAELRAALRQSLSAEMARGRSQLLLWTPVGGRRAAAEPDLAGGASEEAPGPPPRAAVSLPTPDVAQPRPAGDATIGRGAGPNLVPPWLEGERAVQFAKTLDAALVCTRCGLAKTRTRVVFGTGSGALGVMFIGEAPGRDEDLTGEPFVGRAGQLLTKVLAALGWSRNDVYIANVLKCRPPENRDPLPDEVAMCSPYLLRQISLLEPKILCALGNHAAQLLLNNRVSMARLRGRVLDFQGVPLVATYHPAAVLRNPNLKRPLWEDMQLLKRTQESLI